MFAFEKQGGPVPLWRRRSDWRRRIVREAANLGDGRREKLEGYAKGEIAIRTRFGVRQEELPGRQNLEASMMHRPQR